MSDTITLPPPAVELPSARLSKWECEYRAFHRLLPQLLATHRGQFVAVHEEQVVDSGSDKLALALRVLARVGNVSIHVGCVTAEQQPIARSGIRRELRVGGDVA